MLAPFMLRLIATKAFKSCGKHTHTHSESKRGKRGERTESVTRDNPPNNERGEVENGRESGCRNRKRRRNNIETAKSGGDSDQQDGMTATRQRGGGRKALEGYRGVVDRGFRDNSNPLSPIGGGANTSSVEW